MSKLIDLDYIVGQLLDESLKRDQCMVTVQDEGDAKCFIASILRSFDELGYKITQEIEIGK